MRGNAILERPGEKGEQYWQLVRPTITEKKKRKNESAGICVFLAVW